MKIVIYDTRNWPQAAILNVVVLKAVEYRLLLIGPAGSNDEEPAYCQQ